MATQAGNGAGGRRKLITVQTLPWLVIIFLALIGTLGVFDGPIPYFVQSPSIIALHQEISPSLFAAGFTVGLIGWLNQLAARQREEQLRRLEREAQLKVEFERLRLQMGSPFNESAIEAARQLRWRGWLEDGALREATLIEADLQGANLRDANLEGARLSKANLQGVDLSRANLRGSHFWAWRAGSPGQRPLFRAANLQEASLTRADLRGADLRGANLQRAHLFGANLQGANLSWADLLGANLVGADLQGADLEGAGFMSTVLPDDTIQPSPSDMGQFTDSDHPDFWRSSDPESPAYRGANDPDDPGYAKHKRHWPDD